MSVQAGNPPENAESMNSSSGFEHGMQSTRKREANRANALQSTGPRTTEGKSVASLNSLKHGLLAKIPVLPSVESQREWNTHFQLLRATLSPVGYLECILVEKVALRLWRLRRVAQFEREVTAIRLETVQGVRADEENESGSYSSLHESIDAMATAKDSIGRLEAELTFIETLGALTDEEPIDGDRAAGLIDEIADSLDVDIYDDPEVTFPDYPDGARLEDVNWTAGNLKTCLSIICKHAGSDLNKTLANKANTCRHELEKAEARLKTEELKAERVKRRCILPTALDLEKVTRYEAHLERSLYRALHELQRVQASHLVPLPRSNTPPLDSKSKLVESSCK